MAEDRECQHSPDIHKQPTEKNPPLAQQDQQEKSVENSIEIITRHGNPKRRQKGSTKGYLLSPSPGRRTHNKWSYLEPKGPKVQDGEQWRGLIYDLYS